jgi:hypothetical protein
MTSVDERRSQYHAVESLSNESFDCSVPIQVYPTSYETGALFPPTMSFNLAYIILPAKKKKKKKKKMHQSSINKQNNKKNEGLWE